jgi:hypothetical protein
MVALLDLPVDELTAICLQLDLHGLARIAATCKRFRHGDGELETVELPTKSPVSMPLRMLAFPGGERVPDERPVDCSESWIAYMVRCARWRDLRREPTIAAGGQCTLFVGATGHLLACGKGFATGHGNENVVCSVPTPVAGMAGVAVRSVAAGHEHSLALSCDGRVFSWGQNSCGQLGHGNKLTRA